MSDTSNSRRRTLKSRACDRCRRRKAKCDSTEPGTTCVNCREAGELCTFGLPTGKRGPKKKRAQLGPLEGLPPLDDPLRPDFSASEVETQAGLTGAVGLQANPAILLTDTTWESTTSALSPPQTTPRSIADVVSGQTQPVSAFHRWTDLSAVIQAQAPAVAIADITRKCLNLFFEYLFPLIPLVHESSLREALEFFLSHSSDTDRPLNHTSPTLSQLWTARLQGATAGSESLETVRGLTSWPELTFTLITAVCAEAAFLLPKDIFPEGYLVAVAFLQASRNCLQSYLEADLEEPSVNSIVIRYFHSNCLHAAGKPKFSWHIFGEAVRLAQVMQLHDETSHEGQLPLEAELRRRAFWIVYLGDKSAALLNNRPITIHKFSFESGITTLYPTGADDETVLSPGQTANRAEALPTSSSNLIVGFNANVQLWQSASELLLELRLIQDRSGAIALPQQQQRLSDEERIRVDALYVAFATCLDTLPAYLQSESLTCRDDRKQGFKQHIIQAANLQVTYHCLRMMITQKFEEIGYFSPDVETPDMLVLRKTEIARDMLRIIKGAPFWSLQINGEPCVEKIRLIGASLLAIMHRNETSPLSLRARSDFTVLLDILARLDSKASDTLRSGSFRTG